MPCPTTGLYPCPCVDCESIAIAAARIRPFAHSTRQLSKADSSQRAGGVVQSFHDRRNGGESRYDHA